MDPVQHLIHGPTARQSVKQLYRKLHLGEHVEPNETVLLLTTLTSISSYWGLSESSSSAFDTKQTAINVAVLWLRMALDVLEHVRRSASATMETVQAGIIIVFLIYHIEVSFVPHNGQGSVYLLWSSRDFRPKCELLCTLL
jgi:hypothetical protein